MVTDQQVRKLMTLARTEASLEIAAEKSGMSEQRQISPGKSLTV